MEALVQVRVIDNEDEYGRAVVALEYLLDAGAATQGHPLAGQLDALSESMAAFEARHYPSKDVSQGLMLRFLMEQHELGLEALFELGSPEDVASILNGSSQLTNEQVSALSRRFSLPVSVFR